MQEAPNGFALPAWGTRTCPIIAQPAPRRVHALFGVVRHGNDFIQLIISRIKKPIAPKTVARIIGMMYGRKTPI